jgi:hypothetical protein
MDIDIKLKVGEIMNEAHTFLHSYEDQSRIGYRLLLILERFLATLDTEPGSKEEAIAQTYYDAHVKLWNDAIDLHKDALPVYVMEDEEC